MSGIDYDVIICDHCLRLVRRQKPGLPEGWVNTQICVYGDYPYHQTDLLLCSQACMDGWFAAASKFPEDNLNLREGETAEAREALDAAERRENDRRSCDAWAVGTSIIWAPPLKTREGVLKYLGGEFSDWCEVVHDLVNAGAYVPPMLPFDLGRIARRFAEFLQRPSPGPLPFWSESLMHMGELARSIEELEEKTGRGIDFTDPDGLAGSVAERTKPLLAEALEHAAQFQRKNSERIWAYTMEEQAAQVEHSRKQAREEMAQQAAVSNVGGAKAKDEYDVILLSSGDKRIQVIKDVRAIMDLSLNEAKDLVESVPKPLKEGVSKDEAQKLKWKIEEAGGQVDIKQSGAASG